MANDPIKQFLQVDTSEEVNPVNAITGTTEAGAPAVVGLGETFSRGLQAGAEGLSADVEYFKGLFNLTVGNQEAAEDNIRLAQQRENLAAAATTGMQSFEDFLEEPSVDGFLSQVAKFTGQTSVSAITSIAGGGIGGVIGKAVGKKVASKAAQRIAKDSLERTAKGVATPDERLIAQMSYDYAKRGALSGAFGAEYVPAAAGGLREAVESDQELGADTALRSFLVGAPIAAVGTLGEAAILKAFGNVAAKRAVKDGDIFSTLAKDITTTAGRSAAIEGTTEVIQESIAIANRASMDDSFTAQEAALRLGEAAFAGFFSGGALGAAGGAAGNVISRRGDIAEGTGNLAANVVDKARRFLDQGQTQQTDSEINKEQYGDIMSGLTTPESQADINAQLSAMVDETSNKEAVWVAGNDPQYNARPNKPTEITVNGKLAFAAFIPGRGTIISTNRTAVDQVIQEEASDQSLASALGYSAAKDTTAPGDLVVQALDANGAVISEEVTSKDGLEAAFSAANALAPEGGSVRRTTVEKALEERRKRAEQEAGPTISGADITEDAAAPEARNTSAEPELTGDVGRAASFAAMQTEPFTVSQLQRHLRVGYNKTQSYIKELSRLGLVTVADDGRITPVPRKLSDIKEMDDSDGTLEGLAKDLADRGDINEIEVERVESAPFAPKRDPNEVFDNTESLRNDYVEAFGPTDWADPFYGEMSESLLRKAVDEQNGNPTSEVSVVKEDNSYKVVREGLPADSEFDSAAFLAAAVNKAKRSKFARDSRVVIVPPEGRGKPAKINLVDITNAGKRLLRIRGDETFQVGTPLESAKKGLQEILADLQLEGYDILIDGQSLFGIQGALPDSLNVTAARIGNTEVKLKELLKSGRTVTNQTQRDGGGLEAIGFIDPLVRSVIDTLVKAGKFVNPPRVLTFSQLDTATDAQLQAEFSGKALESVIEQRDRMRASETIKGTYNEAANVAVIRESGNALNDAVVAAHELGRALFKQEQNRSLAQRALRNSLLKAFNRDARRQNYLDKYGNQGSAAFEEWYADNVAKWASREYVKRKAASLTDSHFKKVADSLKALYRTLSTNVRKRMGRKLPQEFEQYMDDVISQTQRDDGTFDPDTDLDIETTDMTEMERMQRSSANLDIPQTRIEQEAGASFGPDLRIGRAPTTGPVTGGGLEATGFTDPLVRGVIDALLAAVKFVNPPRILTFAQIDTATDAQLEAEFSGKALEAVIEMRDRMRASESKKGTYSGLANVAIIRETSNPLNDALVIGHELGHALFKQEQDGALSQRALRNSLLKAFNRDARRQSYLDKYSNQDLAFEEWYADNVSKWASREYVKRQAASLTDRHFKKIADRLKTLYRTLSANVRKRLGRKIPQEFEQYMDVVTGRVKEEAPNEVPFKAKQLAAEVTEVIVKQNGEALASHWQAKISDLAKNPTLRPIMKLVRTADGVLRSVSKPIADMFYVRSQDASQEGRLGMLGAKSRMLDGLKSKFISEVGSLSDPEVKTALEDASSDTPTAELKNPLARKVRQFYEEVFNEYIEPSNTNINRRENFSPVVLILSEIAARPDEFVDFIVTNQPGITRERALESVNKLLKYADPVQDNDPITIDPTDPAAAVEKSLILTRGIDPKLIKKAGFLQEPEDAIISYLRHVVTRVEWNTHTKDANGNSLLDAELAKLSEEDAEIARSIIGTYLGYQSKPLSPLWRKINSYGQFLQFVTILPFATIASVPELAGPIINSKELNMDTFMTAFKQIGATIKNRAEAAQFARDINVTTIEGSANAWVTEAEQDFMDTKVRKMSDTFFSAIGLNFFTKFTREFAAGMGVQFILKHAKNEFNNPRSERYLKELGLTAAEVTAWEKGGRKLTTPEGKKVAKGLQRFVESSILRPNAAERPQWASDPHWALVWQLKSFLYAYTKVITGGVFREALNRRNETKGLEQLTATTAVFFLTAIATMPLAMLALELREYAKYGLAWAIPGLDASDRYFRSDSMDWDQYLAEIFDRSGFVGPLSMGNMALQNAEWGKNPILPILGPTAETIDVILKNGFDVGATLKQRLPI